MPKSAPAPAIRLRGVRQNNLKHFDLDLPLRRLIVVTGLSGSGKSSLAFDTLYAEGQRRYLETFSPYARQFFDRMDKPQVDSIEGIPPAIAIEQRNAVKSTRSTVGTMTELCDYLKLLWPHVAQLHCRGCGQPVRKEPPQVVWQTVMAEAQPAAAGADGPGAPGARPSARGDGQSAAPEVLITFDLPCSEKISLADSLALIAKQGYQRLLVGTAMVRLEDAAAAIQSQASGIRQLTIIQDRLRLTPAHRARFIEACEQAYHFGKGKLTVFAVNSPPSGHCSGPRHPASAGASLSNPRCFSNRLHCAHCDLEYREPSPALFSFNHPVGACPRCKGFGRVIGIDYDLAIPNRALTLAQGAVRPWRGGFSAECQADLMKFCRAAGIATNVPFHRLPQRDQDLVLHGEPDYGKDEEHEWPRAWYGVKGYFRWLETKAYKMHVRVLLSRYRAYTTCPDCHGQRLQPDALLHRLPVGPTLRPPQPAAAAGAPEKPKPGASLPSLSLADFYALPLDRALAVIEHLRLPPARTPPPAASRQPRAGVSAFETALEEVRARLGYLVEVGLGYLTLDRPTRTLSGGETERVNLTTCLGTRLVNTLYVLDEPSVGLHPRDTDRLVRLLQRLRDAGNTVVVVEHEAAVIRAADQLVDLGPGHGASGGQVVFQGPLPRLLRARGSLTGAYLSGRQRIEVPPRRPVPMTNAECRMTKEAPSPNPQPGAGEADLGHTGLDVESSIVTRQPPFPRLLLRGAARHNLKHLSVAIPLGRFVCLTGVSGSGKSTLAREVLLPALQARLQTAAPLVKASDRLESDDDGEREETASGPAPAVTLEGAEALRRVVLVDQAPLGKTPRSNPAVYVGAFDHLRELFAQTDAARRRGLSASAFSFNSAQGQCERCRGAGFEKIEMQFLSDVFIRCPDCKGRRYREHILEVKVESRGARVEGQRATGRPSPLDPGPLTRCWSIADLLDATVDEAMDFLAGLGESRPAARARASLGLLQEAGLGYVRLGQPINTLSGGESQRLKLVAHLAEAADGGAGLPPVPGLPSAPVDGEGGEVGPTLFLFDEPTTGLHFDDIRVLLGVFQRLVDAGHSVVVIEHNLDVIKCADWVIDLGPDAGEGGGQVVAVGTPEAIAACEGSHTGKFLRAALK